MYKFAMYKDKAKEWRWKLVAPNGQTIADSGEGYKNKSDMINMIQTITGLREDKYDEEKLADTNYVQIVDENGSIYGHPTPTSPGAESEKKTVEEPSHSSENKTDEDPSGSNKTQEDSSDD
jgi:uncharacterized protein YegP (UPF0339 family)